MLIPIPRGQGDRRLAARIKSRTGRNPSNDVLEGLGRSLPLPLANAQRAVMIHRQQNCIKLGRFSGNLAAHDLNLG